MELLRTIDETFNFENKEIRIIGTYDKPWFIAKDICDILGLSNITNALRNIPEKWMTLQNVKSSYNSQNMILISEPAAYKLVVRSNKPIAQKFQEVVFEDILPSIRLTGQFKIQQILEEKEKILQIKQNEIQEKNIQIKSLENKILSKQNRVQYKDKNCIYILTTDFHEKNRTYILGKSIELTHRLSAYNKTSDHHVIFTKGCKSIEHMDVVEKMVLYKLDKYRERANRDRFILPEDKDISFFIDIVINAIGWFDDIEEYVKEYTDEELSLSNEELQKKHVKNVIDHEISLILKKSETDRIYRENNKEKKAEIDKLYRENNLEKITKNKKEYYEKNKKEILDKQKVYYEENKIEILEKQREYHTENKNIINEVRKVYRAENKDKINEQKKIYREKYKDIINEKQREKRNSKPNPLIECECGIKLKLLTSKSKKHLNSKAHKLFENKKNISTFVVDNVEDKKDSNPLIECECGVKLKLLSSKSKIHLNSKAHKLFENKKHIT